MCSGKLFYDPPIVLGRSCAIRIGFVGDDNGGLGILESEIDLLNFGTLLPFKSNMYMCGFVSDPLSSYV